MSTDRPIPERWREHYRFLQDATDNCLDVEEGTKLIEELGTAESLLRDLAKLLLGYRSWHSPHIERNGCPLCAKSDELLSRVLKPD
jgi:hypothetical protein